MLQYICNSSVLSIAIGNIFRYSLMYNLSLACSIIVSEAKHIDRTAMHFHRMSATTKIWLQIQLLPMQCNGTFVYSLVPQMGGGLGGSAGALCCTGFTQAKLMGRRTDKSLANAEKTISQIFCSRPEDVNNKQLCVFVCACMSVCVVALPWWILNLCGS